MPPATIAKSVSIGPSLLFADAAWNDCALRLAASANPPGSGGILPQTAWSRSKRSLDRRQKRNGVWHLIENGNASSRSRDRHAHFGRGPDRPSYFFRLGDIMKAGQWMPLDTWKAPTAASAPSSRPTSHGRVNELPKHHSRFWVDVLRVVQVNTFGSLQESGKR